MEISDSGKLVYENTFDEAYFKKIDLYSEVHLYFFTHPLDSDAIKIMSQNIDPEGGIKLLNKFIYSFDVKQDGKLTPKETELLLDKSRKDLLKYLRTIT